ncbi:PaaI family thioesterase [Gilvimarinus sp. F26214L]|uniref:PaaI family thioesterase n=1 Tax=Gilvimarinus sp. DZF01 TaxID=3461371 RepID=UPI0040462DCE
MNEDTSNLNVPGGYEPLYRESAYIETIGPVYHKRTPECLVLAMRASEKHCNVRGNIHGGVVSGLLDTAMGYNISFAEEPPLSAVTITLTVDYMGAVRCGDWLEAHTHIQKLGHKLAFVQATLMVGDTQVARGNGVFKILRKKH